MLPTNTAMDSQNHGALLFLVTYATAVALLLFSPKSDAYEWLLTPNMRTDLIYTDNVTLPLEQPWIQNRVVSLFGSSLDYIRGSHHAALIVRLISV